MSFLKTLDAQEHPETLGKTYQTLEGMFGLVPQVFQAMNLRPELLDPIVTFVNRLMIEDHELKRTTKELIAAHVSKINSCAY